MVTLFFLILCLSLNVLIYFWLKPGRSLLYQLAIVILFFLMIVIFLKLFVSIDFKNKPTDTSFFLLMGSSWVILLFNFMRDITSRIHGQNVYGFLNNPLVFVIAVTTFQFFLIVTGAIFFLT